MYERNFSLFKWLIIILIGNFVTIQECQGRAVNISNTWTLPQEGFSVFYRFFRDKISWFEADAVCQFHHANLVTVDNGIQFDAARAFLKELDVIESVWIGLMRPQNLDRFVWTNSKPLDSMSGFWADPLPAIESPLCAVIDPVRDFRWHALRCGGPETAAFLCEMDVPEWATECTMRTMPSLTIQYMSDSGSVELSRDCGEQGTKHMTCKGKSDYDLMQNQLNCIDVDGTDNIDNVDGNNIKQLENPIDVHAKSVVDLPINSIKSNNNNNNNNNNIEDNNIDKNMNKIDCKLEQLSTPILIDNELMLGDDPRQSHDAIDGQHSMETLNSAFEMTPTNDKKMKKIKPIDKYDNKPKYNKKMEKSKVQNDNGDDTTMMMGDQPPMNNNNDRNESTSFEEILPHNKKSLPQDLKQKSLETTTTVMDTKTTVAFASLTNDEKQSEIMSTSTTVESRLRRETEATTSKSIESVIEQTSPIPSHLSSTIAPAIQQDTTISPFSDIVDVKKVVKKISEPAKIDGNDFSVQIPTTILSSSTNNPVPISSITTSNPITTMESTASPSPPFTTQLTSSTSSLPSSATTIVLPKERQDIDNPNDHFLPPMLMVRTKFTSKSHSIDTIAHTTDNKRLYEEESSTTVEPTKDTNEIISKINNVPEEISSSFATNDVTDTTTTLNSLLIGGTSTITANTKHSEMIGNIENNHILTPMHIQDSLKSMNHQSVFSSPTANYIDLGNHNINNNNITNPKIDGPHSPHSPHAPFHIQSLQSTTTTSTMKTTVTTTAIPMTTTTTTMITSTAIISPTTNAPEIDDELSNISVENNPIDTKNAEKTNEILTNQKQNTNTIAGKIMTTENPIDFKESIDTDIILNNNNNNNKIDLTSESVLLSINDPSPLTTQKISNQKIYTGLGTQTSTTSTETLLSSASSETLSSGEQDNVGVDLSNADNLQPYHPNRRRVLTKPETHTYLKKILG